MDIRHLRYFATVAEEGGVSKAASRLHVSQPALSRQIQSLQEELGVRLFEPVGRGIQLTPQGRELLVVARKVLRDVEQFRDKASAFEMGRAGILRVASTPMTIESVLADSIADFLKQHHEVEVQFVEGGGTEMTDFLRRGEADLVVGFLEVDQTLDQTLALRRFHKVPFFVAVHANHNFAGRNSVDIRDLANERVMALSGKFGTRVLFESACRLARIRPRIFHESSVSHTIVALAAAAHGIAVIPGTVKIHRDDVQLVQLCFNDEPLTFEICAAWNPIRPLPPYGHALVQYLPEWFREHSPVPTA